MDLRKQNIKKISSIARVLCNESALCEGADLDCPNCGDRLGKQSEVDGNAGDGNGQRRGARIELYCSNCGHKWKHTCDYDTRN
jgi:predicted RNA-binding Zn-ribbon protein involved in translation (DUF1610 family)